KISLFTIHDFRKLDADVPGITKTRYYENSYQASLFASFPINNGAGNIGGNINIQNRQLTVNAIFNASGMGAYNSTTGQVSLTNAANQSLNLPSFGLPGSVLQLAPQQSFGVSAVVGANLTTGAVGGTIKYMDLTKGFQNTAAVTPTPTTVAGNNVAAFTGAFNSYAYATATPVDGKSKSKINLFDGFVNLPGLGIIPITEAKVRKPSYFDSYFKDRLAETINKSIKIPLLGTFSLSSLLKQAVDALKTSTGASANPNNSSTSPQPGSPPPGTP
ncbi:MAG TPA: hypothetical protein VGM63_19310, partial [Mucilaginibacter sp.]